MYPDRTNEGMNILNSIQTRAWKNNGHSFYKFFMVQPKKSSLHSIIFAHDLKYFLKNTHTHQLCCFDSFRQIEFLYSNISNVYICLLSGENFYERRFRIRLETENKKKKKQIFQWNTKGIFSWFNSKFISNYLQCNFHINWWKHIIIVIIRHRCKLDWGFFNDHNWQTRKREKSTKEERNECFNEERFANLLGKFIAVTSRKVTVWFTHTKKRNWGKIYDDNDYFRDQDSRGRLMRTPEIS